MYKNKKIFVLGMARSGFEVAKLLGDDNDVLITDIKEQDKKNIRELEKRKVSFVKSDKPEKLLDESFDYLIKNPGIKYNHPCVLKARELNIPVINEVEVAFDYLDKSTTIIGITGSNGKTTTTTMIYEIMKKALNNVYLAGNMGIPLSGMVRDIKPNSYLVMEISDHQLCDMYKFKTNVSVLTNISPVHLDFHDSYEKYKATKKKIFNNHTHNDLAIINYDNEEAMNLTKDIPSTKVFFSTKSNAEAYFKDNKIFYKNEEIIDVNKLIIKGKHNYENIMAAILVCKKFNIDNSIIQDVIYSFKGVEHRIEFVDNICGRDFYNDSKSTNVESTKIALQAMTAPTVLLLGGLDRGHSFDELIPFMKKVKLVVCYGETKKRIKDFCETNNFNRLVTDNLESATNLAFVNSEKGDAILLSPACASWDQFECFEDRGNLFKNTAKRIGEDNESI